MSHTSRILILGASGQVGTELQRSFADCPDLVAAGRDGIDLSNPYQLRSAVRELCPQVILNAAAYTAVDRAESEPDRAAAINAEAPCVLAEEAARSGALLVHYSTDYVFDGSRSTPWVEDDLPNPLNVYGATKLAGEKAIRAAGGRSLIFRTSWVYGAHGNNFLRTMLRLASDRDHLSIVSDQQGTPTSAAEIADATRSIVDGVLAGRFGTPESWSGLYHMTCSGSTTWCDFARAIFAHAGHLLAGATPRVDAIPSSEYPTPARRPRYSVLCNERLKATFGVQLAPWESALDAVIAQLAVPAPLRG